MKNITYIFILLTFCSISQPAKAIQWDQAILGTAVGVYVMKRLFPNPAVTDGSGMFVVNAAFYVGVIPWIAGAGILTGVASYGASGVVKSIAGSIFGSVTGK